MLSNSMFAGLQPGLERAACCNQTPVCSRVIRLPVHHICVPGSVVVYSNSTTPCRQHLSSTVVSARQRRKQNRPGDAEQSSDEPVIDVNRKVEAISSQLQVHPNHVRSLVQQHNALAQLPVEQLVRQLPPLAHALSIPLQQALHMVARQPAVLDCDPQQVVASCSRLAAAVQLPVEQVMFLAARQPLLLDCPLSRLAAESQKLAAALGCSNIGALQLLSRLNAAQLQSVLNMSSSTVLQRLPEVVEALGLPTDSTRGLDLLSWVSKNPGLLAASFNDIGRSTDALLVAFQSSAPGTFAAVLAKCPHLLTHPAERLLATYQALLMQLQVSRQTASRMLVKHPQLLRSSPENITQKLRVMAFKLYLPQAQVVSMCVRQPALLSCDSLKLQERLHHLQHLLGTSYQAAVQAAARTPQLLLTPTDLMDSKFAFLQQQTGLPPAKLGMLLLQEPAVLTLSTQGLTSTMQHMQDILQLQSGSPELAQLLLRAPRVLLKGHRVLLEQLRELQEFLVLPTDAVADLVRRCPAILPAGRTAWLANITTMLEVLGLLPTQVQAAVVAEPRLLQLKSNEFLQQSAKAAYVVRQSPAWEQQLQSMSASQLLPLLRVKDEGLLRLVYMHRNGLGGSLAHAAAAAVAPKKLLVSKYPGFSSWLKQQQQQQRQLLPTPAAAIAAAAAAAAPGGGFAVASSELRPPPVIAGDVTRSSSSRPSPPEVSQQQQYSTEAGTGSGEQQQQQDLQQQQQQAQLLGLPQLQAQQLRQPQQLQARQQQQRRQQLWRQPVLQQPRPKWQPPQPQQQPHAGVQQEQQQQVIGGSDSRQLASKVAPALEVAQSHR